MNMAVFQDWTYETVRTRIVEAAETLLATPASLGPRMAGGAMGDVVREIGESYGYGTTTYRRVLAPGALSRMEEVWVWINTYLAETDRKLVYDYSFIKTRKGMYLDRYLQRNDMVRRTFERKINRCCQTIASALNRKHLVRFGNPIDAVSQISVEDTSSTVSSEKCATHWIAPDGKPHIDPDLPLERTLDHRVIRARHSDRNRSLGVR